MAIVRTCEGLVCEECGSDRSGYICGGCTELVCSCDMHDDCPAIAEREAEERWRYEQDEFERRQFEEREQFYGNY